MRHLLLILFLFSSLTGIAPAAGAQVMSEVPAPPSTFQLNAPAPNPTTGYTEFTVQVEEAQPLIVAVYNLLGQPVTTLHEGFVGAGERLHLTFDGSGLPDGIYLIRASGPNHLQTRRVILTS